MANTGDSYVIELKRAHLEWGSYRHTNSRGVVYGEGYIPIPIDVAYSYSIYNSNFRRTGLGYNLFNCRSVDGYYNGVLKAGGSREAGDVYAKQFHGNGDLQALGNWFAHVNANIGDRVEVTWVSPLDIVIRLI
ncbi:hypothetical protein [Dehalobacter sp. TBBPA1]|uniref:hypothetical protein n=1 Tax=Dehalobacter sp. TBBPA1 TaxID=3235037 RepID=UPI0034A3066B